MPKPPTHKGTLPPRPRARRHWVLGALTEPAPAPTAANAAPPRGTRTRFLEPYRLAASQRKALIALLADARIGDRDSRELFTLALEYELARCRAAGSAATADPVPTHQGDPSRGTDASALAALAEQARLAHETLAALSADAWQGLGAALEQQDPFARQYPHAYRASLLEELRRLAAAASARASAAPRARPDDKSREHCLARGLVTAFEACFEQPAPEPDSAPFRAMLRLIVAAAATPDDTASTPDADT